jgi:hypothetical protein
MYGSHNDINVLNYCPAFNRIMEGTAPMVSYEINGNAYDKPYYLVDGIYHDWAKLVKTIFNPQTQKQKRLSKMQEACRKYVEQAFGVLQARWAIFSSPETRIWSLQTMHYIRKCCVSMHNMTVEMERPDGRYQHGWDFRGELVRPYHRA